MFKDTFKKALLVAVAFSSFFITSSAKASDIVVMPPTGQPYGAHEIWANGEIGQSFVAPAANVSAGFYVKYDAVSASLMAPNAPTTQMIANLYEGEGIDQAKLLNSTVISVDTTTNGFLDVNYVTSGVSLIPGNMYTLGLLSPYNRGWVVPGVCDYTASPLVGTYTSGHPFFYGQIVLDETGICDNAFHVVDLTPVVVSPTPTPTSVPTVTPTVTPSPVSTGKKTEGKGLITVVNSDSIVVNSVVVKFTSSTVVILNYNSTFVVGRKAEYKGFKNTDGSVTATKIEMH